MNLVKKSLNKWIEALLILVIGILLIVAAANYETNPSDDAKAAISIIIGVICIVTGSLSVLLAGLVAFTTKKGFAVLGIPGALLIAFGASMCVVHYIYGLIDLVVTIIPYILIALGLVILVDAVITLVTAIRAKAAKSAGLATIPSFILGAATTVLGFLCVGDNSVIPGNVQIIILGILLILYALLIVALTFVKVPEAITVVSLHKEEKESK